MTSGSLSSPPHANAGPARGPLPPDYRVGEVVQRGGMGELLEVTAPDGRPLLLKRIPPLLLSDAVEIERFRREIRILVSLEMSGVPRIEAFDDDPGQPYLLMERVEGETLDCWMAGLRELPATRRLAAVLALGERLARLLDEVHHVGVVHRDLTPRNLMVRADGNPVLLDFGLSRHRQDSLLTRSGDFLGTLRYAPPEQVFASGRLEADRSGDLYALGLLLFEGIAGRPVRDGEDGQAILRQALLVDPPDLRVAAPGTPRSVARVVAALLARDPEDRYPTGAAAAADLAHCRERAAALDPPALPWRRRLLRAWRRQPPARRRRRAAVAGVAVLLLVAGLVAWAELPRAWARRAARSDRPSVALPLLERAAAWRTTGPLLLQKAFTELAFADLEGCRATVRRLEELPEWEAVGRALRVWQDEAWMQGSNWQRPNGSRNGVDYTWIQDELDEAITDHPDDGWLPAWRAWVRLAHNDFSEALKDLRAAVQSRPGAVLLRRKEILTSMVFGSNIDVLEPLLISAREHLPSPEWALWEAAHWSKSARTLDRAEALLPACQPLREHEHLAAFEQAVRGEMAFQGGGRSWSEPWLASTDPTVLLLRRNARAGLSPGDPAEQPAHPFALGQHCGVVHNTFLARTAPARNSGPAARLHADGFVADFRDRASLVEDFECQGDWAQFRFQGGVLSLLPIAGELAAAESKERVPTVVSRRNPFPEGGRWELRARVRWQGQGDYGASLRADPMRLVQDHELRVSIGKTTLNLPVREGWVEVRMVRDGARFRVELDGEAVMDRRLAAPPLSRELRFGAGAPDMDVGLVVASLEIRTLSD